jgi:fluoride ion exporter CrcB/FEX
MLFAAETASFAPLLELVPQASQFAFQDLYSAGVAGGPTPFAQFQLETFEFLAQPVQLLPKLSSAVTLFLLVILSAPAAARILYLIPDSA